MTLRIAYVTSGMGSVGTAICQKLARNGHTVVAGCAPNSPRKAGWLREQRELGFDFIASEGNAADWSSTVAAFAKVKARSARSTYWSTTPAAVATCCSGR